MGMVCALYRATNKEIDGLVESPETLDDFIEEIEGPGLPVREVRPKGILGFLLRLTPIKIEEVVPEEERGNAPPGRPPDPERSMDIEKAWHGLHFLFTGVADGGEEPACYLTSGGESIGDDGYAHALRPDQTRRFAEFLSAITPDALRQRYDPVRMTSLGIYPDVIWAREPGKNGDSPVEWLINAFEDIQAFVGKAAAAGDGMVIQIS